MSEGFFSSAFFFLTGLIVGSFLNVLIFRLPEDEGVVSGRSHCRYCGKTLGWLELIPVLSYLILRGRCSGCKERISIQYILVEIATGLLFVFAFQSIWPAVVLVPRILLALPYVLFILSALIVIFVTDLKHFLILDKVVFPAIAVTLAAIVINRLLFHCQLMMIQCDAVSVLWSLGGSLFFLALVLVSRGTWMGLGDVKLAVLMGLFLGFAKLLVALMLSFFSGSVIGLLLIALQKKNLKSEVPFGAFLVPSTIAAFFYGESILTSLHLQPWRW